MVGANGFEPSTSWSRTRHLNPINALFGVAYGTRSVISPLSVVPNLYLEFGVNPCSERGFLCSLASLLPCCPTRPQPVKRATTPFRRWFLADRPRISLFRSQRLHRIDPRRPPCRNEAGQGRHN